MVVRGRGLGSTAPMTRLDDAAKRNLLKFVCSFVWTDLKVQQEERDLVMRIAGRLGIGEEDMKKVRGWLETPPPPEEVDPTDVPPAHRQLFLEAAREVFRADGKVAPAEADQYALFRDLMGG